MNQNTIQEDRSEKKSKFFQRKQLFNTTPLPKLLESQHRDMMETYLRMIENYEVEKYGGLRTEISDFQSPDFAFKHWERMRHA